MKKKSNTIMLKNTSLFILILSLVLSFSTRVVAQEEASANASSKKNYEFVEVEIKMLKWAYSNSMRISKDMGKFASNKSDGDSDFWYLSGNDYKKLDTSSGAMRPFKYKGPQRMAFYKRSEKIDKNGNPNGYKYTEIANMMIPLGVNDIFVLMQTRGTSASFYPMNVSPKQLPKEKIAVINMTQHNIALLVGGVAKLLRANSHEIFKPKNKKESSIEVQMARMVERKWRPVYRSNISIPDDERCIMLIFDPYNAKTPKFNVRTITL